MRDTTSAKEASRYCAAVPCRELITDYRDSGLVLQNKAAVYDILFKASAETMLPIAVEPANRSAWHLSASRPNPKHLGAMIGITVVLHSWGSAMMQHPHVHMIVPGGGISSDGRCWIACRPGFFLPVLVLSKLFRRLMLEKLVAAHPPRRRLPRPASACLGSADRGTDVTGR